VIFVAVVVASLFCKSLWLMYGILFMGGISETGRYYVAYVYCVEFYPSKYGSKVGLYIFMCFGTSMSLIALRFWLIPDRTWTWNAYLAIAMATMSFFLILFFQPESPRFLYSRKKFTEAETALNKICLMNTNEKVKFLFRSSRDSVMIRSGSTAPADLFEDEINISESRRSIAPEMD